MENGTLMLKFDYTQSKLDQYDYDEYTENTDILKSIYHKSHLRRNASDRTGL